MEIGGHSSKFYKHFIYNNVQIKELYNTYSG